MTLSRNDKSTSISTQMDSLIPGLEDLDAHAGDVRRGPWPTASSSPIEQKIFHAEIVRGTARRSRPRRPRYEKIPIITDFTDENGADQSSAA